MLDGLLLLPVAARLLPLPAMPGLGLDVLALTAAGSSVVVFGLGIGPLASPAAGAVVSVSLVPGAVGLKPALVTFPGAVVEVALSAIPAAGLRLGLGLAFSTASPTAVAAGRTIKRPRE